jgi:hypothetical protein
LKQDVESKPPALFLFTLRIQNNQVADHDTSHGKSLLCQNAPRCFLPLHSLRVIRLWQKAALICAPSKLIVHRGDFDHLISVIIHSMLLFVHDSILQDSDVEVGAAVSSDGVLDHDIDIELQQQLSCDEDGMMLLSIEGSHCSMFRNSGSDGKVLIHATYEHVRVDPKIPCLPGLRINQRMYMCVQLCVFNAGSLGLPANPNTLSRCKTVR